MMEIKENVVEMRNDARATPAFTPSAGGDGDGAVDDWNAMRIIFSFFATERISFYVTRVSGYFQPNKEG